MQSDLGRRHGDDSSDAAGRDSRPHQRDHLAAIGTRGQDRRAVSDGEPRSGDGGRVNSGARLGRRLAHFPGERLRTPGDLSFERSQDWELIRGIMLNPKIWTHISDDSTPPAEEWEPVQAEHIWYVIVRDGEEVLGLFMLVRH